MFSFVLVQGNDEFWECSLFLPADEECVEFDVQCWSSTSGGMPYIPAIFTLFVCSMAFIVSYSVGILSKIQFYLDVAGHGQSAFVVPWH